MRSEESIEEIVQRSEGGDAVVLGWRLVTAIMFSFYNVRKVLAQLLALRSCNAHRKRTMYSIHAKSHLTLSCNNHRRVQRT